MRVLLLDDLVRRQDRLMTAFWTEGINMTATGSPTVAKALLTRTPVDIVVLAERVQGRLAHAIALFAEFKNPEVSSFLITDRTDRDVEELYQLIPSVRGILGTDVAPSLVLQLAKSEFAARPASAGLGAVFTTQARASRRDRLERLDQNAA